MVKFARRAKTKPEADDEDEAPKKKKKSTKPADAEDDDAPPPKKKGKVKDEEDDEPPFDTDDEEEEDAPKKSSKKKKSKPASKDEDDEEDADEDSEESDDDSEEDDEEEAPPKKSKKSKKAKKEADEDDEDSEEDAEEEESDDEEDEAPAKKSKKSKKSDDDDEEEDEEESEDEDESEEEDDAPKKSKSKKSKASSEDDDDEDDEEDAPRKSDLSYGAKAKALSKKEESKAKARAESKNKLFQFYISRKSLNKDFTLTFLDGKLDEENFFGEQPAFYQHAETIGGRLTTFRSCCETEEDPLQKAGTEPKFVTVFTVLDHTGYKDKDGKRHRYLKRLYSVKDKTKNLLIKIAKANGGTLKGVTCTVSRTGDMEPNVGNSIQAIKKRKISGLYEYLLENENVLPEAKKKDRADLVRALVKPADYATEIVTYTAKELKDMGLIQSAKTIDDKKSKRAKELDEELDE